MVVAAWCERVWGLQGDPLKFVEILNPRGWVYIWFEGGVGGRILGFPGALLSHLSTPSCTQAQGTREPSLVMAYLPSLVKKLEDAGWGQGLGGPEPSVIPLCSGLVWDPSVCVS